MQPAKPPTARPPALSPGDGALGARSPPPEAMNNKDGIYQRIMRKLQHQANYADSVAAAGSLSQQVLGYDPAQLKAVQSSNSTQSSLLPWASNHIPGSTASEHLSRGPAPPNVQLRPGVRISQLKQEAQAEARGLVNLANMDSGNSSSLPPIHKPSLASSTGGGGGIATLEEEEENKFGSQPCPATLRLIVEYVRNAVDERLALADVGSLRQVMQYVFESRTLLDKLLKEIPQHMHFQEGNAGGGGGGGGGGNAVVHRVQEMFQEFRKGAPQLLPSSQYALDPSTGRYVPQISAPIVAQHGTPLTLPVGSTTSPTAGSLLPSAAMVHQGSQSSRSPAPPRSLLPATPMNSSLTTGAAPQPPPGRPNPGIASLVAAHPEHFANTVEKIKDKRDRELLLKHLRRRTQLEDKGTLTDENVFTIIQKEKYLALGRQNAELQLQLEEKRGTIEQLQTQLKQVKRTLEGKTRVVQYLRSTLFKEACLLRTQLAAAQQKQLVMQQQQQMLAQQMYGQISNAVTSSGGGGSMGASLSHFASQSTSGTANSSNANPANTLTNSGGAAAMNALFAQTDEVDITSVHSILDLALLGVEKDRAFSRPLHELIAMDSSDEQQRLLGTVSPQATLLPNAEAQVIKLKEEMQRQQMLWKREIAAMRSKIAIVVKEKNKQIKSIQLASDMSNVRDILLSQLETLRNEYSLLRKNVRENVGSLRNYILTSLAEIDYTVKLIADAVEAGNDRHRVISAQAHMIQSARKLLVPMMSIDFATGSHMWLSDRNSAEPLLQDLQRSFPADVVAKLGPDLEAMQHVYHALHRFVIRVYQVPQIAQPQYGTVLVNLILNLLGDPRCSNEFSNPLRSALQTERDLEKRIARLNFVIKLTTWKQQSAHDTAAKALRDAGIDPYKAAPTQKVINRLGLRATMLLAEKAELQRQRMANAKEVHRLWRESPLDPFHGKKPYLIREPLTGLLPSSTLGYALQQKAALDVPSPSSMGKGPTLVG